MIVLFALLYILLAPALTKANSPNPTYDEQMLEVFGQNYTSLSYNVNAIVQSDADNFGAYYLLNGYTDAGYWYQAGIEWNVTATSNTFIFAYEVANPSGSYLTPNVVVLIPFSKTVTPNDNILIAMKVHDGNVIMNATDENNGAFAAANLISLDIPSNAITFVGTNSLTNQYGYFTGLMTEQPHSEAYTGTEQPVTYDMYMMSNALSTAILGSIEYWSIQANSISFASNAITFQSFIYNGTYQKANAIEYITGNYPLSANTPTVIGSATGVYRGKFIGITEVNSIVNGTSPYAYQWYENYSSAEGLVFPPPYYTKAADCGGGTYVLCNFSTNSITSEGEYRFKALVNDTANALQNAGSVFSNAVHVIVNATPTLGLTPSNATLDSGQYETYTITDYNGIGPFNTELYNVTGSKQQGSNVTISSPLGYGLVTFKTIATGTFTYNAISTDQGVSPHYLFNSIGSTITVNPDLTTPTLSPSSSQAILINTSSGQSVAFTASWSDGTPDYTAKLYSSSTSTCDSGSTLVQTKSPLSSSSTTFSGVSPTSTTWYCVVVNDSASTPESVTSAAAELVPFLRYVNITISNNQGAATPSTFQQLLDINSNDYKTYEAGNLDNVEFFTVSGQSINVIPSWLESGNSNSSTGTIYWIKLGSSISAHSDATVYMGMKSLGTNLFNGGSSGTTGEAPQLSGTYGEYDNGANVFNKYTNFSGTSVPGSMSVLSGASGIIIVDDNIKLNNTAGRTEGVYFTSAVSAPEAVDTLVTSYTNTGGAPGVSVAEGESTSVSGAEQPPGSYGVGGSTGGTAQTQLFYEPSGGGSSTVLNQTSFPARPFVYTIAWGATGKETALQNYTTILNSTNNAMSLPSTYYPIIEVNGGAFSATAKYQWLRARAYPPNGVMPSASSGSGGVENIVVRKPSLITCINPSAVKEANGTVMSVC